MRAPCVNYGLASFMYFMHARKTLIVLSSYLSRFRPSSHLFVIVPGF
jgi:hypothetical protein